jgi:hypothetical protein
MRIIGRKGTRKAGGPRRQLLQVPLRGKGGWGGLAVRRTPAVRWAVCANPAVEEFRPGRSRAWSVIEDRLGTEVCTLRQTTPTTERPKSCLLLASTIERAILTTFSRTMPHRTPASGSLRRGRATSRRFAHVPVPLLPGVVVPLDPMRPVHVLPQGAAVGSGPEQSRHGWHRPGACRWSRSPCGCPAVPLKEEESLAEGDVPNPHIPGPSGAGEPPAAGTEGHAVYHVAHLHREKGFQPHPRLESLRVPRPGSPFIVPRR